MGSDIPRGGLWAALGLSLVLASVPAAPARASAASEKMRNAVNLYEDNRDGEAMDLFMDVLMSGDANEKALANDYLNRITRRMGGEQQRVLPSAPSSLPSVPKAAAPALAPARQAVPSAPAPSRVEPGAASMAVAPGAADAPPDADKMQSAIEGKINIVRNGGIGALRAGKGVVVSESDGRVDGVGLPSALVFESDLRFRLDAEKQLSGLAALLYAMGDCKATILPEGQRRNESKVIDMRRAMALRTYLTGRGLSPARVKVALAHTDVEVPGPLRDFPGPALIIEKAPNLRLAAEGQPGSEGGAGVSVGSLLDTFKVTKGEGTILEFSVLEPKEGLSSWKFQMLMPAAAGQPAKVLQEVAGDTPVLHQIYWNGRRNFFGEVLPFGRYEAVLTAKTLKGRESVARKDLLLEKQVSAAEEKEEAEAAELPAVQDEVVGVELGARKAARKLRPKKLAWAVKAPARAARPAVKESAGEEAAPKAAESAPERPAEKRSAASAGVTNYSVFFEENSANIMNEKVLQQIPAVVANYPLANVNLMGYASRGERDAAALAEKRVKVVADLLAEKYQIQKSQIISQSQVMEDENSVVEIFISVNPRKP